MQNKKVKFSNEVSMINNDQEKLINDLQAETENIKTSNGADQNVFYVDMMNNYLEYYKKNNKKNTEYAMFDGIDTTDPSSTNHSLEQFYEEMCKYKINGVSDPNYIKMYKYGEHDKINTDDELFGIFKDGFPIYVSQSFFSLLVELTNLKNEDSKEKYHYEIISLK